MYYILTKEIKMENTYYRVKESGANITRLLQHLDIDNICFISACRGSYPDILEDDPNYIQKLAARNNKNTEALSRDIHNIGYSYIKVSGGYMEDDPNTGDKIQVEEKTFCVIGNKTDSQPSELFFRHMLGLCAKYNQDGVLISVKNTQHPTATYDRSGNIIYGPFEALNFRDVQDFFTSIHGHKFIFENATMIESEEGVTVHSFYTAYQYYGTRKQLEEFYNLNNKK
jgi:hypothetical protein